MKRLAVLLAFVSIVACGGPPPVPPLAHATRSAGLRIRLLPPPRELPSPPEVEALRKQVAEDLRAAGYEVITRRGEPFDLDAGFDVAVDTEFRQLTMELRDDRDRGVDRVVLSFKPGVAPAKEPTRVSHTVVNAVATSPLLDQFAAEKKAKANAPKDEPRTHAE